MNILKNLSLVLVWCFISNIVAQENADIRFETNFKELKVFFELPGFENINVRDMAISPDFDEIFFTLDAPKNAFRTILTTRKINGTWTPFQIAPFSGKYHDIEPAFSPDGNKLFFASRRPSDGSDQPKEDYDIWMAERDNRVWNKVTRLDNVINTAGNEYYPSVANDGSLFFTSEREGSKGKEDIFKSALVNGAYQLPVSLGEGVNTIGYEYNAFVAPDETFIIFGNYGKKETLGKGDLYISFKNNGVWEEAIWLGDLINSSELDYCPFVSSDGNYLFITSERTNVKAHYPASTLEMLKSELNQPQNGVSRIYYIPFSEVTKMVKNEKR